MTGDATQPFDRRLGLVASAFRLKDEERGGWVLRAVTAPESVADHSWGTALLCLCFAHDAGVDRDAAVTMALVHDLAEAETGDVVARADPGDRLVSEADKALLEAAAIARLLPEGVAEFEDLRAAWQAYEDRDGPVAAFVRDMNLVEMCLQAALYQEQARYEPTHGVPSRGAHTHLDEFFASAANRLTTELGRSLYEQVERRYRAAR